MRSASYNIDAGSFVLGVCIFAAIISIAKLAQAAGLAAATATCAVVIVNVDKSHNGNIS